jgi:hypothetical protein
MTSTWPKTLLSNYSCLLLRLALAVELEFVSKQETSTAGQDTGHITSHYRTGLLPLAYRVG